jgi:hypothetical protein
MNYGSRLLRERAFRTTPADGFLSSASTRSWLVALYQVEPVEFN